MAGSPMHEKCQRFYDADSMRFPNPEDAPTAKGGHFLPGATSNRKEFPPYSSPWRANPMIPTAMLTPPNVTNNPVNIISKTMTG